jgi:multisubunit Na+/H+ antiporter MnhG subunit
MNTKHAIHWWKSVIAVFGILPIFAVMVTEWSYRNAGREIVVFVFLCGVVSFIGLLIGSIVLICRHELRWGLAALVFALFTFFVYFMVIPAGYH